MNLFCSSFYNSSSPGKVLGGYLLFHHHKVFYQLIFGFLPTSLLSIVNYGTGELLLIDFLPFPFRIRLCPVY